MDRPMWARDLNIYAWELTHDGDDPRDEEMCEEIEMFIKDRLCRRFGHEFEYDMCNRPEHQSCLWCGRLICSVHLDANKKHTAHECPYRITEVPAEFEEDGLGYI